MNLDAVSERIKQGRLDPSSVITMHTLRDAGLIGKKVTSGVKLLGRVGCKTLCTLCTPLYDLLTQALAGCQ